MRKVSIFDRSRNRNHSSLQNLVGFLKYIVIIEDFQGVEIPEVLRKEMHSGLTLLGMLDTFKWVLIVIGVLTMICSFLMVMYRERLLCFAKMSSGKVSITEVKETRNSDVNSFNNTVLYPTLYPQVENKNVHDRVVHRNTLNTISQNTWQLKN